jgi:hypothetical protein
LWFSKAGARGYGRANTQCRGRRTFVTRRRRQRGKRSSRPRDRDATGDVGSGWFCVSWCRRRSCNVRPHMPRLCRVVALLVVALGACAHRPRRPAREREPVAAQPGCYAIHVMKRAADPDMPPWFREHVPRQVALTVKREDAEGTWDPGWRLAALGPEPDESMRAIKDGAWWPLERTGIEVRLGDGFSGVRLRLKRTAAGFMGEASTYQDVGDQSYRAYVWLDRLECKSSDNRHLRAGVSIIRRSCSGAAGRQGSRLRSRTRWCWRSFCGSVARNRPSITTHPWRSSSWSRHGRRQNRQPRP